MRVYKLTWICNEAGHWISWHGSKREAEKASTQAKRDGCYGMKIEPIDFDNTKAGILALLRDKTPELRGYI